MKWLQTDIIERFATLVGETTQKRDHQLHTAAAAAN